MTWIYSRNSRYSTTPVVGEGVDRCLARRIVPRPDAIPTATTHRVIDGERLDSIASSTLGDPELWWRIADANPGLVPSDLTAQPGRVIRIGAAYSAVPIGGAAVLDSLGSDGGETSA